MQKLVIFDLDGTLIDTSALMVGAVTKVFLDAGLPVPDAKAIRAVSGLGFVEGFYRLAPNATAKQLREIGEAYQARYLSSATVVQKEALFGGVPDVLGTLSGRDDILMSVATGKSLAGTNRVLHAHNIYGLFSSIHTPDTCLSKPHPDMIETAMGIVCITSDHTLMVGDTTHDMEMAVAAGVKALGVSYGYHAPEELAAAGADMIIDEVGQILGAIDELIGVSHA